MIYHQQKPTRDIGLICTHKSKKKQAFWSSTVGFVIKVALTKLGSTIVFTDNMARHKNMEDPNQTQLIIGQ